MGKKAVNMILFLAVAAAAVGMTVYVGQGAAGVMIYNFIFLGIILLIYITGMFAGMFRMNNLAKAFQKAAGKISGLFKKPGRTDMENLACLNGIFEHAYLDRKMDNFTTSIGKSEEGIGDIDEYINEDELDTHIHKRLLEMVPDILTSLGILGTFIGLVWGLKNFDPNNYEAMTTSVASLVDGIKVAFLTSIYGISFSIVYTYGTKSEYSAMTEQLQAFLEKFHAYVMPTAENESRNLLVSSQKMQTQAVERMAKQVSEQMAGSFEKVITPTFQKMNDSLDMLVASVTRCQQDAVKDILDVFLKEMRSSFQMEFQDFNEALAQLKRAQKENAEYTKTLYENMGRQLSENFVQQDRAMKENMTQLNGIQKRFMDTAGRIVQDNQNIQKIQQQDYKEVVEYLREAEQSAAKFWVACNQTMQKYVETAGVAMEKAGNANQYSADLLRVNREVVVAFNSKMKEFNDYLKNSYATMEELRSLLSDITVAKEREEVYLMGGRLSSAAAENANRDMMEQMHDLLESQGAQQQALLDDMAKNIRDLSRAAQKNGKFGLFK